MSWLELALPFGLPPKVHNCSSKMSTPEDFGRSLNVIRQERTGHLNTYWIDRSNALNRPDNYGGIS